MCDVSLIEKNLLNLQSQFNDLYGRSHCLGYKSGHTSEGKLKEEVFGFASFQRIVHSNIYTLSSRRFRKHTSIHQILSSAISYDGSSYAGKPFEKSKEDHLRYISNLKVTIQRQLYHKFISIFKINLLNLSSNSQDFKDICFWMTSFVNINNGYRLFCWEFFFAECILRLIFA